mmetsp:Transcript_13768/g.39563  ORF Transcript_13768/g.39563 Transcript_13768/m.39563 type:complete len:665 (+) Transcript_13768:593-2587(+)
MRRHHHPRGAMEGAVHAHVGITMHRVRWWLTISRRRTLPSPVWVSMVAVETGRTVLSHWWCHAHAVVMMVRGWRVAIVGIVPVRHAIRVAVGWGHLTVAIVAPSAPVHQLHVSRIAVVGRLGRRRRGRDTVPSGSLLVVAPTERGSSAVAAQAEVVIGTSAAAPASSPTPPLSRRSRLLLLLSSGRNRWHRWSASWASWTRQAASRGLGRSAYRRPASGDGCTSSNGNGPTRRLFGPRGRHGLEKPNINLISKKRAFRVGLLSKGSQILLVDESAQRELGLGGGIGPTLKEVQSSHPLLRRKVRASREVVRDCAYFRSKESRYWRDGVLNVDAIPLELLDALGQELVVVNQRPEVSPSLVVAIRLYPWILPRLGLPPAPARLPQLRPALAKVGHGVGSLLITSGTAVVVGGNAVLLSDGLCESWARAAGVLHLRYRPARNGTKEPLLLVNDGRRRGRQGRGGGRRGSAELGHGRSKRRTRRWTIDGDDEGAELLVHRMIADVVAGGADGGHTPRSGVARHRRRTAPTTSIGRRVVGGHVAGLLVDIMDDAVEGDPIDGGSRQVQGEDGVERERNGLAEDGDLGRRTGLVESSLCGRPRRLQDGTRSLLLMFIRLGIAGILDGQALDIELLDAGGGASIAGIALHNASICVVGITSSRGGRRRSA